MSSTPPPSRLLADVLRAAIENGTYRPGDKLPSERDLAATHGIVRNTAAAAIAILKAEGLVESRHGSGAYVRRSTRMIRLGAERYSDRIRATTGLSPFRAEALKQGKEARVEVPFIGRAIPPADVADRLGVSVDEESVVKRVNHYYADNTPVQIGITYSPWAIVEGTVLATEAKTGRGSIYARFADLGHQITQVREEISSRMPRPEESRILQTPPGVPVIDVLHTGIDQHGEAFEVTHFVMRADLTGLDYTMPVENS